MAGRTTRASIKFSQPFSLAGLDGIQPAGTYRIQTIDVALEHTPSVVYRRVSTTIEVPEVGSAALSKRVVTIDPIELEAALKREPSATSKTSENISKQSPGSARQ
jgi:hypothetical protein